MQLHRISGIADWEEIGADTWNGWQRVAAWSRGVITVGNLTTVIGLGLIAVGLTTLLNNHYWSGLALLISGRLCDLLDGWLADLTSTKGPVGEFLDVTVDKLTTIATLVVLFTGHLAPWWLLSLVLLPHVLIPFIKLAFAAHKPIRPSQVGKLSMALSWLCLFGFVLVHATSARGSLFAAIVDTIALVAAALGFYAAAGYLRAAHRVK